MCMLEEEDVVVRVDEGEGRTRRDVWQGGCEERGVKSLVPRRKRFCMLHCGAKIKAGRRKWEQEEETEKRRWRCLVVWRRCGESEKVEEKGRSLAGISRKKKGIDYKRRYEDILYLELFRKREKKRDGWKEGGNLRVEKSRREKE